ncbi:NACHT domain-containing protein [Nocardia sp. NPDC057272]|uniref:NACHT domain-containing protein n=1 Tax=Nocardia sp. NPDC057272 TaxID=3346079 RepID=UPI003641E732
MSLLDRFPFDEHDPGTRDLLGALCAAFPKSPPDRLLQAAGLALHEIDLTGAMVDVWPRICRNAAATQRLRTLIETIAADPGTAGFTVLQDLAWTPPQSLGGTGVPWSSQLVRAAKRERLELDPEVLPNMQRAQQLTRSLHRDVTEVDTLVLIGEGGLGKSVLLGQIFDAVIGRPTRQAILVPCNRVSSTAALDTVADIDRAFGAAALDHPEAPPLTDLLRNIASAGDVHVLVDTVDLVVRERNADAIAGLLSRIAGFGQLVWTCRDHEWTNYLRTARGIAESQYVMPLLTGEEISAWARAFVGAHADITDDAGTHFIASLAEPGAAQVLATPLRLAMACDVYAESGAIPDDLTVTALYDDYWTKRIAADRHGRGARSANARRQVAAANALAEEMWLESEHRFATSVSGRLNTDEGAFDLLLSDGAVVTAADRFSFFHQTFGEYAVARHLRRIGTAADFARLRTGLDGSLVPAYWPIARHLPMLAMDDNRFDDVCAAIPLSEVEGVKAQLAGAFARRSPQQVLRIDAGVPADAGAVIDANASVLANAPAPCHCAALEVLVARIEHAQEPQLPGLATGAAQLIAQIAAQERPAGIGQVLDALCPRTDVATAVLSSTSRAFIAAVVAEGVDSATAAVLIDRYEMLPPSAQRVVLRAIKAMGPDARDIDLIVVATRCACPEGSVEDLTALLIRCQHLPGFRTRLGWVTWRDIMTAELPARWDSCQVRLVAHLCTDPGTAGEVLRYATAGEVARVAGDRCVNVAKYIADTHRELALRTVTALGSNPTTTAVGVACAVVNHTADSFDRAERLAVTRVLSQWIDTMPRKVWPSAVKACGTHSDLLADRLRALLAFRDQGGDASAVTSAYDTFLNITAHTPGVLAELAADLRTLVPGTDPASRTSRARLDGLVCGYDPDTWARIVEYAHDPSTNVASAAMTAVGTALAHWPTATIGDDAAAWLVGLLNSPHTNSVRIVAVKLHDLRDQIVLNRSHAEQLFARLELSLDAGEDPQTADALLTLLIDIDRAGPGPAGALTPQMASAILSVLRATIERLLPEAVAQRLRRHLPALFGIYKQSLTALGLAHLGVGAVEDEVAQLLMNVDVGRIASRSQRLLAHLLIVLARADAEFLTRLEDLWPTVSDANRAAIAEAFITIETATPGLRSLALARRPDCPPGVAGNIHRQFG